MNLTSWLTDTVTVAEPSGVSAYGDPTFGTKRTVKARVEGGPLLVKDGSGVEVQADYRIVTESEISVQSRVWLPGDDTTDNNAARRPVSVRSASTKSGGATLYEVVL
jgi:hypothetical protein